MPISVFKEMIPLAPLSSESFAQSQLQVSLIIPARQSAETLEETVKQAHAYLKTRYPGQFEIILVPNPKPGDLSDPSIELSWAIAQRSTQVRVVPHLSPPGKGAALRTGVQAATGRWIFFTDSDLPYDLSFFDEAAAALQSGAGLVVGNRRLGQSTFRVPVGLLRLAYRRHQLGLSFNRLVRWMLPITTTDTQAGIKALLRPLAIEAFSRQRCPGFLFDLELFLTAHAQGYRTQQLPVTLHLNSEKSTVRVLKECVLVLYWLTLIVLKNYRGDYQNTAPRKSISNLKKLQSPTPLYPRVSWDTRFFLFARWLLTPYLEMAKALPPEGLILDLGCGHGLLAFAAVQDSPRRKIYGLDHDPKRVKLASQAFIHIPEIQIREGDFLKLPCPSTAIEAWQPTRPHSEPPSHPTAPFGYQGIAMIDVLHYFDFSTQKSILKDAYERLEAPGTLIVREVEPNSGLISTWNRFYETLATGIGFTQSQEKELFFRTQEEWCQLLREIGFEVTQKRCSSVLFSDILYLCEKTQPQSTPPRSSHA
ncbi:MAG: glycosyltransferase [Bdellovibrionia bacterium]